MENVYNWGGITLKDGTYVSLYDTEKDFAELLNDRLGYEAQQLFEGIVHEASLQEEGDDWELIADAHFQELMSTLSELEAIRDNFEEILGDNRLSREKLYTILKDIKRVVHDLRFNC